MLNLVHQHVRKLTDNTTLGIQIPEQNVKNNITDTP
jgi:hypothetical protein